MIGEIILCVAIFIVAFTLYGCAVADSLDDYDKDEPEDLSDAKPYVEEKKDGKND